MYKVIALSFGYAEYAKTPVIIYSHSTGFKNPKDAIKDLALTFYKKYNDAHEIPNQKDCCINFFKNHCGGSFSFCGICGNHLVKDTKKQFNEDDFQDYIIGNIFGSTSEDYHFTPENAWNPQGILDLIREKNIISITHNADVLLTEALEDDFDMIAYKNYIKVSKRK